MRFLLAAVCWLLATAALAIAIPALWAQRNIVDEDGYAALAQRAAGDTALQSAMASELTTRAMALIAEHGGGRYAVDGSVVHAAATAFTASSSFPPLFAQVNRAAHRWLFSDPLPNGEQWAVDVAPMLKDSSFRQILSSHNVKVPDTLKVPLTVTAVSGASGPQSIRQGQLHRLAVWGPWVSFGAAALSGVFGLLTLLAARRRGKAMTSLGVGALLVGAAGWAVIEAGGGYVNEALNRTTGDIRRIADAMVGHAEGSLHLWLNVTLLAGVALVALGVLLAVLGGLFKRS
ncbi:hypothetical protein [Mycobacterium angelicum]|uniref:Uncharacterized protein n=1 Tax=Mycobacterium angelicum TaxID=470074 RepID=A0A1W9ZW99_MYCAN|nr:hypothetical protein [Mycobacterium angelicum]MCV7198299.1 hypothetical protein [Mycobacterium angelicum]ORA21945.1 hypothetical protein BST12_11130 [Mycobacterium angelicum]